MTQFDYVVIGNGLIGSAAGRYLSTTSKRVALIGPDEPSNWVSHQGVFASHYDQGRITRILDEDIVWALLAKRSIAEYRFIEQESGINFHHPVGGLQVAPVETDFVQMVEDVGIKTGATFETLTNSTLQTTTTGYQFPTGTEGVLETGGAGHIHPRSLVKAQLTVAQKQGATIIRETVQNLAFKKNQVEIQTDAGHTFRTQKVLLAAGAFVNHLLPRPLAITPRGISIFLGEVAEADMPRLSRLPSLIYKLPTYDQIQSIYMIGATQYPDGKHYLKIGGSRQPYHNIPTFEAQQDWFHGPGDVEGGQELRQILMDVIPNLNLLSGYTKPCVTTYTESGHPFIDTLEPDHIYVVAAGNGAAAKSSNEIGRVAAMLVEKGEWAYDLSADIFKAQYEI
ncbi:MAG: FAD-dependent oxidoreductase [Chloroflexota bacterium]